MGLYGVPLLLGFGMGMMLANCHMCGIMLLLRAVLNMQDQAYMMFSFQDLVSFKFCFVLLPLGHELW